VKSIYPSAIRRRTFLAVLAAQTLLASSGHAAGEAGALLSKPRFGAELFLNRSETRESVSRHLQQMSEAGMTIVRIFTIWDHVERKRGEWDFTRYDWVYDDAARHGILVANTLCAEDPPGWMGTAPFYHQWTDLTDPKLRPLAESYIEKVVQRYKDHPAHGVWLLQNEPFIRNAAEPHGLAAYARWLERKYGTVEHLNAVWYKQLRQFDDARLPEMGGWSDYAAELDWRRFRIDHLIEQLRWLRAQVERWHPGALTHANPPGVTGNMPGGTARDVWRIKSTVHFIGTSVHPSGMFVPFAREDFGMAYGYCCDVIRSASAPAPWWVTEVQGGNTVFTATRHLQPTAADITRFLWDGVGNGARAVIFWLWHPRTEGREAGEWGLAGPSGESTERTQAVQTVARALSKHGEFFSAAQPVPARAAILYGKEAMLLYSVDRPSGGGAGGRGPVDEVMHSLMGCYKALHRAHVPVDFIDNGELQRGAAKRYRVLYLPNAYALSAESAAAIREFVQDGGTIWADGLVAWKNEQGATTQFPPGPLSDVFGFTTEDFATVESPFPLGGGDRAGERWRLRIRPTGATVVVSGPDGSPAAVEHKFGQGKALYYASAVTLGYFHRGDAQAGKWIAAPAVESSGDLPVRLAAGSSLLSFRALQAGNRWAAVLNNWGLSTRALVVFPKGARKVRDLVSDTDLSPAQGRDGVEAALELNEGQSAVLIAQVE
jgi:beta-galactosidase